MAGARDSFGEQNKFITPVVANGKVYVATASGVGVFGLLPSTTIPAGWTDSDIGNPREAGSAGFDGTTWTVAGGGAGITGRSDQFNFVSQDVAGDQTLIARITSISNTNPATKAGVMFRNDDSPGSIFASLTATAKRGLVFQWRSRTGGIATGMTIARIPAPSAANPLWVELVRTGSTFTAEYSRDGTNYKRVGKPITLSRFGAAALAGLAVTAHKTTALAAATFDQVAT